MDNQETTAAANNQQLTGQIDVNEAPLEPNPKVIQYYEFSTYSHGTIMFIHLWDDNDLSACERICNGPLGSMQIGYSQTGNGFFTDKHGNEFCFKKEPYLRTFTTPELDITAEFGGPVVQRRRKPVANADDILAGL